LATVGPKAFDHRSTILKQGFSRLRPEACGFKMGGKLEHRRFFSAKFVAEGATISVTHCPSYSILLITVQ
jgi:hypothetical protein